MVECPEGVEILNLGILALLPVNPPEVYTIIFIRLMKNVEVSVNIVGVCDIKGDFLSCCRVNAHTLSEVLIHILEEAYALSGMKVDCNLEVSVLKPL